MDKNKLLEIIKEEGGEMDFEAFGLPCYIKRNGSLGHWCGYVQVPRGSRLFGKSYYTSSDSELGLSKLEQSINNLDVHGGLTYSGDRKNNGNYWFGFDCGHGGDLIMYMLENYKIGSRNDIYRTKEFVIDECINLARQLVKIIDLKL